MKKYKLCDAGLIIFNIISRKLINWLINEWKWLHGAGLPMLTWQNYDFMEFLLSSQRDNRHHNTIPYPVEHKLYIHRLLQQRGLQCIPLKAKVLCWVGFRTPDFLKFFSTLLLQNYLDICVLITLSNYTKEYKLQKLLIK